MFRVFRPLQLGKTKINLQHSMLILWHPPASETKIQWHSQALHDESIHCWDASGCLPCCQIPWHFWETCELADDVVSAWLNDTLTVLARTWVVLDKPGLKCWFTTWNPNIPKCFLGLWSFVVLTKNKKTVLCIYTYENSVMYLYLWQLWNRTTRWPPKQNPGFRLVGVFFGALKLREIQGLKHLFQSC